MKITKAHYEQHNAEASIIADEIATLLHGKPLEVAMIVAADIVGYCIAQEPQRATGDTLSGFARFVAAHEGFYRRHQQPVDLREACGTVN